MIPGYVEIGEKSVGIKGLINSGADATIINSKLVKKYNLPTVCLLQPLTFRNAHDSVNSHGTIMHQVEGVLKLKCRHLPTRLYVANLEKDDIILGMPWIHQYNPRINWQTGRITIPGRVIQQQQKIPKHQQEHDPSTGTLWGLPPPTTLRHLTISFIETMTIDEDDEGLTHNPIKAINHLLQTTRYVRKTNKSTEIAIAAKQGTTA